MPDGITDKELRGTLREEYGITISGGQEHLKGRIFRIGHMGNVNKRDLLATLSAIEEIMLRKGVIQPAIHAAMEELR